MIEPVFVDRTGRRRRVGALAGSAGALVLLLAALALVAGFTGTGPGSLPGWAGSGTEQLHDEKARPVPAPSGRPSSHAAAPAPTRERARTSPTARPTTTAPASTSPAATRTPGNHRGNPGHTPPGRSGRKR